MTGGRWPYEGSFASPVNGRTHRGVIFLGNLRTTVSENGGFNQCSEFTEHSKLYLRRFEGAQKVTNEGSGLSLKGLISQVLRNA